METIKIYGSISRNEYIKVNLFKLLRHWYFWLIICLGIYYLIAAIIKFVLNTPDKYSSELATAIGLLVLVPMFFYYRILKGYNSSKQAPHDSVYEISSESIQSNLNGVSSPPLGANRKNSRDTPLLCGGVIH